MKKLIQFLLALVIAALIFVVYLQISTPIRFEDEQKAREKVVIERLKDIRTAQRQFKSKYQRFTADFDTLINFVLNEQIEGERKIYDEDDSIGMARLKKLRKKNVEKFTYSVKDSMFKHLTPEQVAELRYIPFTNNQTQFLLDAGSLMTESKVVIPVVECKAPYIAFLDTVAYRQEIINLVDNCMNNLDKYPGIKFGSMEGGNNEAGNWE
ncbi:MAG: hypothetical protein J6B27_05970 [Alistipes sp.]|nr:hypothetical protein [Alistipes sp.]MBQ2703891.1 hypothetical protein [Alistipes sp.]